MSAPLLQARALAFAYGRHAILQHIDLDIRAGELLALLGINGAGKSTLLRLLLGFEAPHAGNLEIAGKPLTSYTRQMLARQIAYVPQAHTAQFPYTVTEVILLGRLAHRGFLRAPSAQDRQIAETVIAQLGIGDLAQRAYTTLSGGERQLTLIARALAQQARILILDEPASALDYGNQIRLLGTLRRLADDGYAILFTTHHPEHVLMAADRAALLIAGRIAACDKPATVLTAQSMRDLYGIEVEWHTRSDGGQAFWPVLKPGHGQPAPI